MTDKKNKNYKNYKKQTQLVRGGLLRSQHGETSEAIFMNSGYVFNSAEEAKARFAGELDGYVPDFQSVWNFFLNRHDP